MSWKDLKIAKKLYIGFGIVLILAGAIGYVGWDGLDTVAQKVENADDANRLIKWAKDCRLQEKNFIMRGEDVGAIEEAYGHVKEYEAAFDDWVRYRQEAAAAMETMVAGARVVNEEAGALRAGQKAQMEQEFLQKENHQKLAERWGKADDANRLIRYMLECRQAEKNWLLRKDDEYAEAVLTTIDQFIEQCGKTRATMKNKVNLDQIDAIVAAVGDYKDGFETYRGINEEQLKSEELMVEAGRAVVSNMDDLRAVMRDKMEDAQASAITMAISFVVGAVLLGIFVAFVIARGISKPVSNMAYIATEISTGDVDHTIELESKDEIGALANAFRQLITYMKELAHVAEMVAKNDLTVTIDPKSEKDVLGNSFKTMVNNLAAIVTQLAGSATEVASASAEISTSAEQVSRGAQQQEQQVAQVSTAVEEMTATIVESSKNAGEATEGSKGASDTATEGGQIVNETIEGMGRIATVT